MLRGQALNPSSVTEPWGCLSRLTSPAGARSSVKCRFCSQHPRLSGDKRKYFPCQRLASLSVEGRQEILEVRQPAQSLQPPSWGLRYRRSCSQSVNGRLTKTQTGWVWLVGYNLLILSSGTAPFPLLCLSHPLHIL